MPSLNKSVLKKGIVPAFRGINILSSRHERPKLKCLSHFLVPETHHWDVDSQVNTKIIYSMGCFEWFNALQTANHKLSESLYDVRLEPH